ncbi:MAG: amidohydrolase [candidate division WOR-3 bacterium]
MEVYTGNLIPDPASLPFWGKLVVDEGKIAALLPLPKPLLNQTEQLYITPGFIDSHTHPLETGLALLFPDLSPAVSVAECIELLSLGLTKMPDVPLLFAFNFDPDRIKEHRYLYRRELDKVTQKKPVFVYRVDGHSAVANSSALDLLGEKFPSGVELDGAGKPTGVIRAPAYEALSATLKNLLPSELIREAISLTAQVAMSKGVTTIAGLVGWDGLEEEKWAIIFDALGSTPIRIEPFFQTWNINISLNFGLKRVGGCLLLDGSFGSHTAALNMDYADAPGYKGELYQTEERLLTFLEEAEAKGLQTAFHAIGDRAIEQLVSCHEKVKTRSGLRHRIEHAELLNDDLIKRIAQLGLVLCVQPTFATIWGGEKGMYAQRLGERWRSSNPLRTLWDNKILIAGGSDSPITPIDPLGGIRSSLSLPNEAYRLNAQEAFALFTINAAYSLNLEEKTGQLKPGLEADFVFLNADPREVTDCQVISVYRKGRQIFGTK